MTRSLRVIGRSLSRYVNFQVSVANIIAVILVLGALVVGVTRLQQQALAAVEEGRKGPACVLGQVPYQVEVLLGSLGIDSRKRGYVPAVGDEDRVRLCTEFLRTNAELFQLGSEAPSVISTPPTTPP